MLKTRIDETMVTSKVDSQSVVAVPKMNSLRPRKPVSSNSSGFRLMDGDQLEINSSVSRNSIYKLKIDLMFDDSRSMRSNRLDDPRGSHRTRSIIMYGRSELASTAEDKNCSLSSFLQESNESAKVLAEAAKKDVQRITNSVQAQIEQLFTDVAKDATSSFEVTCLGSLPLKDKVTSLQGLQEPLRQLYLNDITKKKLSSGFLDICTTGLRVKLTSVPGNDDNEAHITPFHNIAVWSAVKFVISEEDGGAAFLPLITDPDNIDKTALFKPLSAAEQLIVEFSVHAPIFAVVMRATGTPKILECHGFICKNTEDAIVIAATLYQSLMAHVSISSHRSTKRRTPRQQNGVSCISIASSSAMTSSNYLSRSQIAPSVGGQHSSFRSSSGSIIGAAPAPRSARRKRISNSSLSCNSNVINEAAETSTEERRRKSHKSRRAPPVPTTKPGSMSALGLPLGYKASTHANRSNNIVCSNGHVSMCYNSHAKSAHQHPKKPAGSAYMSHGLVNSLNGDANGVLRNESNGDILTRVAIPRSGSFLNTGGLTRYKSRAARRNSGKLGGGGGGGELFNEFRLHENLHSLDDILYAIIDADGMSFNDLKPIYKEFLLKLAVTLTQDELFQRSKNIMRRQKKKQQKRKSSLNGPKKKSRSIFFGTKSIMKVFQLGQFRSCRGKVSKSTRSKEQSNRRKDKPIIGPPTTCQSPDQQQQHHHQHQRNRAATSGSDVSVVRNEHALQGLNRNSSSGYVSCSECSYDSETCTCVSADRCYCSLRTTHTNHKLRNKNERDICSSHKLIGKPQGIPPNRHSLISCKSEDKCYCSMVEEEPNSTLEHDSVNSRGDTTTSCDSDSCVSASKCYCKRTQARQRAELLKDSEQRNLHATSRRTTEKLGVDYELFTIGGNSKPVQPHEALSVKKSVEAAAVFADMKLSQTTDIKSLCPPAGSDAGSSKSKPEPARTNSSPSEKLCSADDLLNKLNAMEKSASGPALSFSSSASRSRMGSYQSMRVVGHSLEDSLGYLP